ncbi:hypothetical protein DVH24_003096 [Malus domestica]|uniref:Uncharacterized protein n=1 Tax=Malus domestica TaxID=3750 RepID=A0A498K6J6_MALDO|nr:hypothetical protein DVH24_003096 [Malus domestica]
MYSESHLPIEGHPTVHDRGGSRRGREKRRSLLPLIYADQFVLHKINSWSFNSSLVDTSHPSSDPQSANDSIGLAVGVCTGIILASRIVFVWFILWKKRATGERSDEHPTIHDLVDKELDKGTGPKKFSCKELACTTSLVREDLVGFIEDLWKTWSHVSLLKGHQRDLNKV